jgi:hypothetical protein
MSDTLRRLDGEIARLRAQEAESRRHEVQSTDRDQLQHRLVDLQDAKNSLLQMRSALPAATQTAWQHIQTNWNRLEVDINARLQSSQPDTKPAESPASGPAR